MIFIQVVLTLQGLTLPHLNPGVYMTSRSDCVSGCYFTNTCNSMIYDVCNHMCHMLYTVHGVHELDTPSPGHQYLVFHTDECLAGYIWIRTMNLCYNVHTSAKPWHEAEAVCTQDGGHLIQVETEEVNSFVNALALQGDNQWIGGRDEATEGTWLWSDGSAITFEFWYPNQPEGDSENCLAVFPWAATNNWHDYICSVDLPFICQIRLATC